MTTKSNFYYITEFTMTNRLYSTWLFVAVGSNTKAIGECLKYVNDSHSTNKYRRTARAFVISESTFRKSCKMEYPCAAIRGNKTWITGFKALKENKKGGGIFSLLLHEKEFLNSYSRWMTSIYPYHPVLLSISLKQKLKHMCKSNLSKEETNKSKFRGGLVAKTFCKS